MADGINNLSDCGSSVVSLISFKIASKPADKKHPYGHQRIEYVASMIISFLILIVAVELVKESVNKIINPSESVFSYLTLAALIVSILVKLFMFFYQKNLAKKINSEVLKASAKDSISDTIATTAVLVGVIVSKFTSFNLDGYLGILVSLFIAWSGISVLKDTISELVGKAAPKEVIDEIKEKILSYPQVLGIHDLSVYSYGPDKYYASVHIELDSDMDVVSAHEIIDTIEKDFSEETEVSLTGHLDPISLKDPETIEIREKVYKVIKNLYPEFSPHDLRIVKAQTFTNVIFEVAIPFDEKLSDGEIEENLQAALKENLGEKYRPVLTVERKF